MGCGDATAIDGRTDVYALGAVLRSLLAHPPPSGLIPKPLASVCEKAMASEPVNRYATALELADDVGRFLDLEPVTAHREGAVERVVRFASRHRVVLSLLGAYLLLRVVLIVMSR